MWQYEKPEHVGESIFIVTKELGYHVGKIIMTDMKERNITISVSFGPLRSKCFKVKNILKKKWGTFL